MSINPWNPWDATDWWTSPEMFPRRRTGQGESEEGRASGMPLDVEERDNDFVVTAALPGVAPQDIQVNVRGDRIEIRGQMRREQERQGEQGRWLMRELRTGQFFRLVTLPSDVDADNATASYADGMLTITLPKARQAESRTIPVQTGTSQTLPPPERPIAGVGSAEPAAASAGAVPTGQPAQQPAAGAPQTVSSARIRIGMEVVGPDGGHVGSVKDVRASDFLLNRSMRRDVYVPLDAVLDVTDDRVVLSVEPGQIDAIGWQEPRLGL